jgi:hypothetical protein
VHQSNSDEQQSVEQYVVSVLNERLCLNLAHRSLKLTDGISVQIDGFDEKSKTICEIYARIGRLKGSQPDKIASDILKMQFIERHVGGHWNKIICFCDDDASSVLSRKSWLAKAARSLGINVQVVYLPEDLKSKVISAQNRQKMVNAK